MYLRVVHVRAYHVHAVERNLVYGKTIAHLRPEWVWLPTAWGVRITRVLTPEMAEEGERGKEKRENTCVASYKVPRSSTYIGN